MTTTVCDFAELVSNDAEGQTTQAMEGTSSDRAPLDLPEGVPPLRAFYLYLSNGCNLRCRHCWITPRFVHGKPDPGDVIDVDALREAVTEAKSLGLKTAKLTGGEPMLHPRFMDIVDMLTAEGIGMNMETNGTLLTSEIACRLKDETNVTNISVSIDATDARTHDGFRGVPGAFDSVLCGLGYLVDAGYENTQVIMSVHRGNLDQIEGVVQLAASRGAGSVKFNPVVNTGRGEQMQQQGETLDFEQLLDLARYVRDDLRGRSAIKIMLNMPLALTPLRELERTRGRTGDCGVCSILGILGTGEIALCGIGRTVPKLVYGCLGKDSIREIWLTHPTILELRRTLADVKSLPGICGRCTLAKTCRTGCVAQNYLNDRQLVWPGPLCSEATERGQFPSTRLRA